MHKINEPTFSISAFYDELISNVEKKKNETAMKKIYAEAKPEIESSEKNYDRLAKLGELYLFPAGKEIHNNLDSKDMGFLYKKFRKESQYYSKLREGSNYGICPYCEKGEVSQLDHYLSQKNYSDCVIIPKNLIPCCGVCNLSKKAHPKPIVHPYFDDTNCYIWAKCTLKVKNNILVPFCYLELKNKNPINDLDSRIANTWEILELQKKYVIWINGIIVRKTKSWSTIYCSSGISGLIDSINHEIDTMNEKIYSSNSYEKIFYTEFLRFLLDEKVDLSFLL